jgi:omega-6 fatty acid desaturase (delta-12 desaturase)
MSNPIAEPRRGRALHNATRPFATESVARSWLHVASTFVLITGLLVTAAIAPGWPLRVGASLLGALVMVRGFILYHDHLHGALLPRSALARAIFRAYGAVALTPPRSWRDSHNYHHAHVGTIAGSNVGSFPLMTTAMWNEASRMQRVRYRITRHPLTVVFGYLTIFLGNIVLRALFRDPRRYWDSAASLLVHGGLVATVWITLGFWAVFFSILLPVAIAAAMGGYLFFAQHNFRGMRLLPPEKWNHFDAALASSSYMKLGPVMRWFTGNIGYHHIHHLNSRIPFYRLPEVMAAIPEVQHPNTTSLRPSEIADCFRLALWDPDLDRMVTFRELRARAAA